MPPVLKTGGSEKSENMSHAPGASTSMKIFRLNYLKLQTTISNKKRSFQRRIGISLI